MTLSAETIRALAPAPGFGRIDRYLPDPYRRALSDIRTPLAVTTRAMRDGLDRIDHETTLVQRSRALKFFTDLDDGARLGALHAQSPWPEEDVEMFRARLTGVAALAMEGAASAGRMLRLIALAAGAELRDVIPPPPEARPYARAYGGITLSGTTEPGQTRGVFAKPDGGALFTGDVIDAPPKLYTQSITPLATPDFGFRMRNHASASLPTLLGDGTRRYPDPVFRIETTEALGPLALIQTFEGAPRRAPRIIVVNRRFPAGAVFDLDVGGLAWNNVSGPKTVPGPWRLNGTRHMLYAGLTEIALPGALFDNEGGAAAGYAMTLRAPDQVTFTGALEDRMVDQGPIPAGPLTMPSLLGDGESLWRVLRIDRAPGDGAEILNAGFTPLPATAGMTLTARWAGRRAGEFAVQVDDAMLHPGTEGPLPHRARWLEDMINRFKLAGTVRVTPIAGAVFTDTPDPELSLRLATRATTGSSLDLDDSAGRFDSHAALGDSFELITEQRLDFASPVELSDRLSLSAETAERTEIRLATRVKATSAIKIDTSR